MKKKRSWLKRILLGIALVLTLIAAGAVLLAYMSGSRPDWYRAQMDDAALGKNYDSALKKLGLMQNWAQNQQNWPTQATRPRVDTDPTTAPAKLQSIALTEDELNAVLSDLRKKLLERYGESIADPYIAIHDGHVVLAVTHKGTGRIISVHFAPKLDEKGMFILSADTLMAGRIPIPKALWSGYTDKVTNLLTPTLENVRQNAAIDSDGSWNESAVVAANCRLVLNSMKELTSDAVLFLPPDLRKWEKGYPVKISEVKVEGKTLAMTVTTLDAEEQQRLLLRLRAPANEDTAAPITAKAAQPIAGATR
jgi:hypothetical protein